MASLLLLLTVASALCAQDEPIVLSQPLRLTTPKPPVAIDAAKPVEIDKPLPISLPAALQLANVRPVDVQLAAQRVALAAAQLDRARVLWLPTIHWGGDYFRHDGQLQDVAGTVFGTSKSTMMFGAGPSAVFALGDAYFAPLAERQVVLSREAALQTARNDSLLAVAEAYFDVQQARGELAGAFDAARRTEELVRRTEQLAPGLIPQVEAVRARTELARRRQAVHAARGRWRTASAELSRLLRLEPSALVEPIEPPHLQVELIESNRPLDELIPLALTHRPELAAQQAIVQATLQRLRQERLRPLVPSILLRGAATNPSGTLSGGAFGGGFNDSIGDFGSRHTFDLQVLWELQNLGLGNRARINERGAENRLALLELMKVQDRVAAETAQAHAQLAAAAARLKEAESGLKDAVDTVQQSFNGLSQTKRIAGEVILLVIRPQEVVAAIQSVALAYGDYYGAIADYDRAQFRLYRALGQPAQSLAGECEDLPPIAELPVEHVPD